MLFRSVSHELRTPLTAIVTYGEVLTDELLGPLTDRQREAVEAIIHSSKQLLQMIEEVLTYARASAQAIRLEPSTFDLREVVREVHRANASLFVTRGLAYEEEFGADLPLAWGDRAKIQHVLANLVGNALDFTPAPGRITVRVRRWPENPAWLEVLVADTGIGIDPQYHELIFREFAQVDSSHARRHHGTGLGLTIARNFVQMHGGRIWVESALGAGSRFYFTVPTVEACAGATP